MAYYRFPQGVKKGKYKLTIKFKSNTADKQGIIRFVQRTSDNASYGYLYISANEEIGTTNAVYPKLTTAQVQTGDFIDLTYYVDFSSVDDSSKVFLYLCSNKNHLALYEFKDIKLEEVIE